MCLALRLLPLMRHALLAPQTALFTSLANHIQQGSSYDTLLGAGLKGREVSLDTSSAIFRSNPSKVFKPVPTAVPPWAKLNRRGSVVCILSIP